MQPNHATITKSFCGIEGRAFTTADLSEGKAVQMRNFRCDKNGVLRRREGYEKFCTLKGTLRGYCFGKILGSLGKALYYCTDDAIYAVFSSSPIHIKLHDFVRPHPQEPVEMFFHGKKIYLLTDGEYYVFDHNSMSSVEGYIPLRYDDLTPFNGEGTEIEAPNALTRLCRARYSPKEISAVFLLPELAKEILSVTVNGQPVGYRVDSGAHDPWRLQVLLEESVPAGTKTVEILYRDMRLEQRERILKNTHCYRYGGSDDLRLFFYGNDRAEIFYSVSIASHPEAVSYFPYDGVLRVSTDAPVTGILRRYNHLLIHTPRETFAAERDVDGYRLYLVNDRIGNEIHGNQYAVGQDTCCVDLLGVYRLHMTTLQGDRIATRISDDITDLVGVGALREAKTIANEKECEIWFATPDGIWVYRYDTDVWYCFDCPPMDEFLSLDTIAFRHGDTVYRYDPDLNTDNGAPIVAFWEGIRLCRDDSRRPAREVWLRLIGTNEQRASLTLSAQQSGTSIAKRECEVAASPPEKEDGVHALRMPLPCAQTYRLRVQTSDDVAICAIGLAVGEETWQ